MSRNDSNKSKLHLRINYEQKEVGNACYRTVQNLFISSHQKSVKTAVRDYNLTIYFVWVYNFVSGLREEQRWRIISAACWVTAQGTHSPPWEPAMQRRLSVFKNRVLRTIFGLKGAEGYRGLINCITTSFIICTFHQIVVWSNERKWGWECSMHGTYAKCIQNDSKKNPNGRGHLWDIGVDGRVLLKWI
jgi:hypothetical protein